MDIDSIVKIGALLVALLAIPKIWRETEGLRLAQRRNSFDLARELTDAIATNKHPFLIEVGYQSLFRATRISAPKIVYLLSMPEPSRALDFYNRGHHFLVFGTVDGSESLSFRKFCATPRSRNIQKYGALLLYGLSFFAGAMIIFKFQLIFGEINPMSVLLASVSVSVCLFISIASLTTYEGMLASEKLIKMHELRSNNSSKPTPLRGAA